MKKRSIKEKGLKHVRHTVQVCSLIRHAEGGNEVVCLRLRIFMRVWLFFSSFFL